MAQDNARLIEQPAGYFKLERVGSDDLAYHLGFRNGDIPQKANGYTLKTWDDYATAITQLDGQTSFTITVKRGTSTITLQYEVV